MDSYTLNTVNYNYKTLSHEGFGGVCKYIATPKRIGYSRLLVKHENIQSACNTFMCSRLAELCDVYTPKAYLMSTSDETRRLFPMHPFIVGTEWVEDLDLSDKAGYDCHVYIHHRSDGTKYYIDEDGKKHSAPESQEWVF